MHFGVAPRISGLPAVAAAFMLLSGLLAAPATAAPAPAPHAPLDQSVLLGQVVPGLVDINTTPELPGCGRSGHRHPAGPRGRSADQQPRHRGRDRDHRDDLANSQTYPVDVIGYDRDNDIALIRLRGAGGLPTAAIGTSSSLAVGDAIAAIGNSNGTGGAPSYAPGAVTQLGATVRASDESGGGTRELHDLIRVAADIRPAARRRPGQQCRPGGRRQRGGDPDLSDGWGDRRRGIRHPDRPGDGDREPDSLRCAVTGNRSISATRPSSASRSPTFQELFSGIAMP